MKHSTLSCHDSIPLFYAIMEVWWPCIVNKKQTCNPERERASSLSTFTPSPRLTCVLSELVHRLEVYDVGREPVVHLAEDHAPSAGVAAPYGRLYLVGDGGAVGPPPAVFVQPFPHHHGRGQKHVVIVGPGGEDTRWNTRKHTASLARSAAETLRDERGAC